MKKDKIASAGIERTEEGEMGGFNVQWLAYDDRKFGDILSDWLSHTESDTEKFSRAVGLNDSLTKDDITQLISGDKVPSRELTNFLCAVVPPDVCSWRVLRNRGYSAAGNGRTQVTIPDQALKAARLQKLKEIAASAANGSGHATNPFVDWLAEIIDETARRLGRTADPEKSMANIAKTLGITVDELKGITRIKGDNIAEKAAEDLARLFGLEGDEFGQAVSFATSAWLRATSGKPDMAYSEAIRFLRLTRGMDQKGLAKHPSMRRSVINVERAIARPEENFLDELSQFFQLTTEEQLLLRDISEQYDKALQVKIRAKLEPVAQHFAAEGLTIDDMMHAALRQPQLFCQKPETLIRNIEGVVEHFKGDGLTLADYLGAAVRQPQLFHQKPETIIRHINLVIGMYKERLIVFNRRGGKKKDAPPTHHDTSDLQPVFNFLVKYPALMCLADDNYMLRIIYSAATHAPSPASVLSKPKGKVEGELRTHLGHQDKDIPVPKIHMPEGLYDEHGNATGRDSSGRGITPKERLKLIEPHSKNLLLRALIREGLVTGQLGQDAGHLGRA